MALRRIRFPAILTVLAIVGAVPAVAQQQVTVSSPHTAVSDSFYEYTGTSWGARGKNWFFQFGPPGNPNGAAPQFGGFNPSAGANFGFGFNGGGFLGTFSQGSRRSFTSVTPSVTIPNGGTGMIMDTSVSPFVMGYVPVVGGAPIMAVPLVQPFVPPAAYVPPGQASGHPAVLQALQNVKDPLPSDASRSDETREEFEGNDDFNLVAPRQEASALEPIERREVLSQTSSAERPSMSVAEARRLHAAEAAEQDIQARQFLQRGRHAQEDGKLDLARTYYRMAVRRASPDLRQEALKLLASAVAPEESPQ